MHGKSEIVQLIIRKSISPV